MLRRLLHRFSGPQQPDARTPLPPRPAGHVIWCHAPRGMTAQTAAGLSALLDRLADALAGQAAPPHLLLTGVTGATGVTAPHAWLTCSAPDLSAMPTFLTHWSPSAVLWLGAGDSALATACGALGPKPVLLSLSATAPLETTTYAQTLTGPLCPDPVVPPCNEAEADDLSGLLQGRPVWLAVLPPPEELPALIAAHRAASQMSHRLLLLLALPEGAASGPAANLSTAGWQVRQREDGQDPDDGCEIYIIEGAEELGLWYRLSPVTFLGGTLGLGGAGGCSVDPLGPACMGSALISGPDGGTFAPALAGLRSSGAVMSVTRAGDLRAAVVRLLSPEQTAQHAAAGWHEATKGAPLQNALMDLLLPLCQSPAP